MYVKFDKFPKNNLENIEILSSVGTFSNDVNWRRCELLRISFEYMFTHFTIMKINMFFLPKIMFVYHTQIHPSVHN